MPRIVLILLVTCLLLWASGQSEGWRPVELPPVPTVYDWQTNGLEQVIVRDQTVWILTQESRILRRSGNRDWEILPEPPATVYALAFEDDERGWAVGKTNEPDDEALRLPLILRTTDGGVTWSEVYRPDYPGSAFYDICLIDSSNIGVLGGIGASVQAVFVASADGGKSWAVRYRAPDDMTATMRRLAFVNVKSGWLVGDGVTLRTHDGGTSWLQQRREKADLFLGDICALDEHNAWVVGLWGLVLHTNDGGRKWKKVRAPSDRWFTSVVFSDAMHGWIGGCSDSILNTTDGGKTWATERLPGLPKDWCLRDLAVGDGSVWAVGGERKAFVLSVGSK